MNPNKSIIRDEITNLTAYHVPDAKNYIKLDAMENPYVWGKEYKKEWLDYISKTRLNRYPDSNNSLKEILRTYMKIPNNKKIILGNGSDELIQIILMSLTKNSTILSPVPSFAMYEIIAKFTQVQFIGVPLDTDFQLNLDLILDTIKKHQPEVIFIANPNNPTGNIFDRSTIETIIQNSGGLVILDEAYFSFTDNNFMEDLNKYDNLLIMRTVSKIGLAGVRLGLLAGDKKWIDQFNKIRLPYNINSLTQQTTQFVFENIEPLNQQIKMIKKSCNELFIKLKNIENIDVFKSDANFILFRVHNADEVYKQLKANKILLKNLHNSHPLINNCLRVTIGTNYENQLFIDCLSTICSR